MHRSLALGLVAAGSLLACGEDAPASDPQRLAFGAGALELHTEPPRLVLTRGPETLVTLGARGLELGLVRALDPTKSYDPYWLELREGALAVEPPSDLVWSAWSGLTLDELTSDEARLSIVFTSGASASLTVRAEREGHFSFAWVPTEVPGGAIAWMRLVLTADPEEAYYGLGEWMDHVNHRGRLRPMQMEADLSIESANTENHVPVPLLIGTTGWGVFVQSRRVGLFDPGRKAPSEVEVTYGTGPGSAQGLRFHLYHAAHPLDVTGLYYQTTAFPKLPARWAYGPLIWRDENRDQAEVEADIRTIRALDLATSGIWIDRPYATDVNTFDFKPSQFPAPARMIQLAHDHGLRMALWHTPYVAPSAGALHEEAQREGYFPPKTGQRLNGWSEPLDLTNPTAYAWWQDLIRRYTAQGIEGFKLDYGEDVSVPGLSGARAEWRFHDGSDERTMHHDYTVLYHRVYAETFWPDSGFLLCRAGKWGDQVHPIVIWPGDLDANFARFGDPTPSGSRYVGGLPASVVAGLSLGPSGFPFYGSDTGGYRHSPPNEEVYIRWFQQTALSSVMQVGDSSSQPPWVYTADNGRSDRTLALYREFARLHLRLFPYVWSYAARLATDGRALTRALGLAHPELGEHPDDTYLLGDHLLVAPVVEAGAVTRPVTLPAGAWLGWFDDERLEGGATYEVAAPLETLPLFVRAGAVIPMLRESIDTLAAVAVSSSVADSFVTHGAGRLTLRATPGPASRLVLHDDSVVAQRPVEGGLELELVAGREYTEGAELELHALGAAPSRVQQSGRALDVKTSLEELRAAEEGWYWDGARLYARWSAGTLRISR